MLIRGFLESGVPSVFVIKFGLYVVCTAENNYQAAFSLFARRVLIVTITRRAIPTKAIYQEGGAPSAIISERTAGRKKAPRIVPRMVPLPPGRRGPPTTTAAIDCSSIPAPRRTSSAAFLARSTTA